MQSNPNEEWLVENLKNGNEDALKLIFQIYAASIYNMAENIIDDAEAAQRIVVNAFIRLWKDRQIFTSVKNIYDYLHVITRASCDKYLKNLDYLFPVKDSPDLKLSVQ